MKTSLKVALISLTISPLVITSCGEDDAKPEKEAPADASQEPLNADAAIEMAYGQISKFVMEDTSLELGRNAKLDQLAKGSKQMEASYKKAMHAHPDLTKLIKAKKQAAQEPSQDLAAFAELLKAAEQVPELRVMKDKVNRMKLLTLKETANVYEAKGHTEIAKKIRDILARVK